MAINEIIQDTIEHWKHIAPVIHEPQNQDDYDKLSSLLDALLDIAGENESHELIGLIDVISHMITMYDDQYDRQINNRSGTDATNNEYTKDFSKLT